jgi:hypothetical protein
MPSEVQIEVSLPSPSAPESGGGSALVETPEPDPASVASYLRPPLHEPNGSTYSDVGMPYPLPDVVVVDPRAPRRAAPPPEAPAFVESSFGPTPPSPPFVETSFGPPPPSIGGFPESSFGPDAGP